MNLNEETLRFIQEHSGENPHMLALQAQRYPSVQMQEALLQIAGQQIAREKIPTWSATRGILYPAHISLEQCSSEATARYKAEIVCRIRREEMNDSHQIRHTTFVKSLTDLTGGFGVDCAFLATLFERVTYVEKQETLCQLAAHNFPKLGLSHITICHEESGSHLQTMEPVEWIYIDPSRRNEQGTRKVAIADCEPNVSDWEEELVSKARHLLIKLSPMLDLTLALRSLKHVQELHVVAVGNECKEVLLLLEAGKTVEEEAIPIHCINLTPTGSERFTFTRRQERESECQYTSSLKSYLYEPNSAILKAGAFRSLAHRYQLEKLHPNSHLYTSEKLLAEFPGHIFLITGCASPRKKEVKKLLGKEKSVNLTIRNFPISVDQLRHQLNLSEGGEGRLFATTLADEQKVLIRCQVVR